jgi:hypothetical protein
VWPEEGYLLCAPGGGNLQRENVQPVVRMFAKAARGYLFLQIPIGGCDDSHIRVPGSVLPYTLITLLLQKTQQLALESQRDFTDLVQEQGSSRRGLETAGSILDSPGERALGGGRKIRFQTIPLGSKCN